MRNVGQAAILMASLSAVLAGSGFIWPKSLSATRNNVTRNTRPRMVTASDREIAEWNRNVRTRQVLRHRTAMRA